LPTCAVGKPTAALDEKRASAAASCGAAARRLPFVPCGSHVRVV
jgi:hypothetical protein